jgi:hypothetical protein
MSITIGNVDNLYTSQECKLLKFTIDNEHGYSKKNMEYPRSRGPNKRGPDTKQYTHSVLETVVILKVSFTFGYMNLISPNLITKAKYYENVNY